MHPEQPAQPAHVSVLQRNHTTSTTTSNVLAPDGGVLDVELEKRWNNVKSRLSVVLRNMQDHPLKTLPAEWGHIYTDVARLYTENDVVRKRRMYNYVRQFIRDLVNVQLRHLRPLGGTVLLSEYVRRWRTTMTYVQFMKRVLHHLQRVWISENANTLKHDPIRPLDKLLMFYWREDLLSNLHSIVDIALALVDYDRRGIPIDHSAVRGIVDNLVEIGTADLTCNPTESDPEDINISAIAEISSLQLYIQVFEDLFIVNTRSYYKNKGLLMTQKADISSFMVQVKRLLDEEEGRALVLLHIDSAPRVLQAVEEELIGSHKVFLQQHAKKMIEEGREDDLRRVYDLLNRIEGAMDPVRAFFVKYVRKEGDETVGAHIDKLSGKEDIRQNLALVELLVRLYLKHANMVKRCFGGANNIMLAIDDAFRGFANRSLGSISLPNLLAHYIDQLLKSNKPAGSLFVDGVEPSQKANEPNEHASQDNGKDDSVNTPQKEPPKGSEDDEDDVDPRARYINELVRILMYLDDKDMFFETHRRLFAKRLLLDHDEDMETLFITKLREQMGTMYTQRLSGMLQDIQISNTLREDFDRFVCNKEESQIPGNNPRSLRAIGTAPRGLRIDFDAHVLNALHWPSVNLSELAIPEVLSSCEKTFAEFYMLNTETRKLTWVHSMSTVHLKVYWGATTHTLVVSTFQACLLMLFNDCDKVLLSEAATTLNVDKEELRKHIRPLYTAKKCKLLTMTKLRRDEGPARSDKTTRESIPVSANTTEEEVRTANGSDSAQLKNVLPDSGIDLTVADLGEKSETRKREKPDDDDEPHSSTWEKVKVNLTDADPAEKPETRKRERPDDGDERQNSTRKKVRFRFRQPSFACRPLADLDAKDDCARKDGQPLIQTAEKEEETKTASQNSEVVAKDGAAYDEVLSINLKFSHKQHRIIVPSLMPRLASTEASVSKKNVVIDRSTQVDAAVMRIMKRRRQVSHSELCADLIQSLSAMMFTPDVKLIKNRLDRLIDQDYIVRDEIDPKIYKYNT